MGRKIPGRKHRGIRDPEKQRLERYLKIKDKINAPPADPEGQEIPKSLTNIIRLKEKVQKSVDFKTKKKNNKRDNWKPIMKVREGTIYNFNSSKTFFDPNEKTAPIFMHRKGEPNWKFISRVNEHCQEVIKEAEFEKKFNVEVHRSRETGEVTKVTKKPKDELVEHLKKMRKESKRKSKKKKETTEPKLTKSQKRLRKLKEKKAQNLSKKEEKQFEATMKDEVKFGEVVHGPPSLTAPKKVKKLGNVPRPGKKDLLLKSMLNSGKCSSSPLEITSKILKTKMKDNNSFNKKGKRKGLPVAMRRQLDKQQKEVINAYRELKKNRRSIK